MISFIVSKCKYLLFVSYLDMDETRHVTIILLIRSSKRPFFPFCTNLKHITNFEKNMVKGIRNVILSFQDVDLLLNHKIPRALLIGFQKNRSRKNIFMQLLSGLGKIEKTLITWRKICLPKKFEKIVEELLLRMEIHYMEFVLVSLIGIVWTAFDSAWTAFVTLI